MANHGGKRAGAGRPAGAKNKATVEQQARLTDLARGHTVEALETLLDVMRNGLTDTARIAAANSILDRAYGRPKQSVEEQLSIAGPSVIELVAFEPSVN
jgi:hypothetical protein